MKKYVKIIIPVIVIIVIVIVSLWYMNKNKLEPGFANLKSNNWPELINNEEEMSEVAKAYIYSIYGDGKQVNIESLEAYHPEDDKTYIQLNYGQDIYIVDKMDNTIFIFKSDLVDGKIDTTIDYNNEHTHVEQPSETVLEKVDKLTHTLNNIYKDYELTAYEANQYPTVVTENVSKLYVRRDDGFAQFSLAYFNNSKDKTLNLAVVLEQENIIGVAIQIN